MNEMNNRIIEHMGRTSIDRKNAEVGATVLVSYQSSYRYGTIVNISTNGLFSIKLRDDIDEKTIEVAANDLTLVHGDN